MSRLDDPAAVAEQYAGPGNFDARVRIYRLYARAHPSWIEWLWDQIGLVDGERVLEAGVGTGNLWIENASRLPRSSPIVLTDLSAGMLATARGRLAGLDGFEAHARFQRADVQHLPFPDACFDVAIACHMLYHVPDRARGIAELARVLAPGGRCCVGTNDWTHQIELRELIARFQVDSTMMRIGRDSAAFDLETAADELAPAFGSLRVAQRQDRLDVTDATAVGDYVRSACPNTPDNLERIAALEDHVARRIQREGLFRLTVSAGLVVGSVAGDGSVAG